MKAKKFNTILFALAGVIALLAYACQDDDFQVPVASTQADFTYEVDTIIDAETGSISFGVQFINQSILAQSYHWNFGNGETSTEENPYTVYEESGQYTVTLQVTSQHDLHYNRLSRSVTLTFAIGSLPLPFSEDFNSVEGIPNLFTVWDLDGDGLTWYWGVLEGDGHLRSQSWDPDEGALEPDNWLILPQLDASAAGDGATIKFRFYVGVTANTPAFRQEHYGVFISTSEMEPEAFELIFEETFADDTPRWEPLERVVDISAYAGQQFYIAIRHYNVSDKDRMFVDKVEVFVE
jgi:hypothetical protein